jgi:hypothetical protein
MKSTVERRYLLGDFTEEEKSRIEKAFFADDSQFDSLELAEEELIDAYIRDALSAEEQQQFRAKLLTSPRIAERVHFAKVLKEKVDASIFSADNNSTQVPSAISVSKPTSKWWGNIFPQQPVWRTAIAASFGLVLVAGLVLVFGWLRLRSESELLASERAALEQQKAEFEKRVREEQTRAEQANANLQRDQGSRAEELRPTDKPDEPKKIATDRNGPTILALTLSPGSLRSEGSRPELIARTDSTTAQLRLVLQGNDYKSYKIAIKGLNKNKVVFSRSGLKPRMTSDIILPVPMKVLPPDDYTVSLYGLTGSGTSESVEDYYFRVSAAN